MLIRLKKIALLTIIVTFLGACSSANEKEIYKKGIEEFNKGNYEEARDSFKATLDINKNRAEYHIDYGLSLSMLGEYNNGITILKSVIQDKKSLVALENNKLIYRGLGLTYYLANEYDMAMKAFKLALSIEERSDLNEDIYRYMASAQTKSGSYEEAINSYTKLIELDNEDARLYNDRAFAYGKLEQYDKGIADFNRAIQLDKHEFEYYFGKYFLQLAMNQAEEAKNTLSEAERLNLDSDEADFKLAKVHYFMEKYDIAMIEFEEASRRGFHQSYYYLGNIYEIKGDYEKAVINYTTYIDNISTDKNALVYNQLGYIYIQLGDYKNAVSVLEKGMSIQDINIAETLTWNYITALEGHGEYDKAYEYIKEYNRTYPGKEEVLREMTFIETRLSK